MLLGKLAHSSLQQSAQSFKKKIPYYNYTNSTSGGEMNLQC